MDDKKKEGQGALRSKRMVYLRKKVLKMTQQDIEEKLGISSKTLQNWENVRYVGLTEKGADKLIEAFKKAGLECTKYWLLDGIGEEPWYTTKLLGRQPLSFYDADFKKKFPAQASPCISPGEQSPISSVHALQEELKTFYKMHPTAIDAVIGDDSLAPCYLPMDHVAGCKLFDDDMEKAVGLPCIVQLRPGETLVRQLCKEHSDDNYTLRCTNPNTTVANPIINNVTPLFVAPIIWIRKPDIN